MVRVIFTLDYEIHGNGDGCPYELMVEPTHRMLKLFERYGAKLTIMADVAEILKFKEYKDQFGRDDYYYDAIVEQLRDAIRRGHDVQLHLHSSYFNARYEGGRWLQDWTEYNFAGLGFDRLKQVIRIGKDFLEGLLRPVSSDYRCFVFRAANWSVSPSKNVVRALVANGIKIDTSVFKYGGRNGLVTFDYTNAYSELLPWPVDENDICCRNESGALVEVPIYSERRWIGAFVTPNRIRRALSGYAHRINDAKLTDGNLKSAKTSYKSRLLRLFSMLVRRHAWKADFNQCTGYQLIRALKRADRKHNRASGNPPFVLIGHSKLFSRSNGHSLKRFLQFVSEARNQYCFGTFDRIEGLSGGLPPG